MTEIVTEIETVIEIQEKNVTVVEIEIQKEVTQKLSDTQVAWICVISAISFFLILAIIITIVVCYFKR